MEDPVIDVDALERPYPLPRCFSSRDFMEKRPPYGGRRGEGCHPTLYYST
ncbi:hypothetical protein A2U01_0117907, partial [Trifolium medium]|nr:hypothetical protein [Trifolium medium]